MALGDWSATFEASPPGSQSAGEGDDRIREERVDIRVGASQETDWGDATIDADYADTRRLVPGAARAYYIDNVNQTTLPTTLINPAYNAQAHALAATDDGRLAICKGSLFFWTGTAWAGLDTTATTGHFAAADTVTGANGRTTISAATQATAQIMVQDAVAGTPELNLDVTPGLASVGFWRIQVQATIPWTFDTGNASDLVVGIQKRVDPLGVDTVTPYWPVGVAHQGGTDTQNGAVVINRSIPVDAADRGTLHRIQVIAHRNAFNATIGTLTLGDEVLAHVEAKVIPHG